MINLCVNTKFWKLSITKCNEKRSINKELYFINYYLSIFNMHSNLIGINILDECNVKYFFESLEDYPMVNYNNSTLEQLCKYIGIIDYDYRMVNNNIIINIKRLGNKTKCITIYHRRILMNKFYEFANTNDKTIIIRKVLYNIYADLQHKNLTILYNILTESLNRILS